MALTDTIVSLEEDLQGHIKYATGGHRNRMIFRPIYPTRDAAGNITSQGSYMYSTSYATGYNVGNDAGATICNPDKLATGIWGPAHEVGHSNQIAKGLKWAGTTEVTNNICSGYVMYTMNGGLEKNAKTSFTDREAFNNGIRDIALNPDKTLTHFAAGAWDNMFYAKAIPFWQLYLYYTYIGGYPDLYKDVYNKIRNRTDNKSISDGEAQINFVKLVSETDQDRPYRILRVLAIPHTHPRHLHKRLRQKHNDGNSGNGGRGQDVHVPVRKTEAQNSAVERA
ncbi:MAG: M60 family metallopeptidase [Alistipes putredinis]|nr:MAG: M60 family metallopeptidase [Alistipes putredinis]